MKVKKCINPANSCYSAEISSLPDTIGAIAGGEFLPSLGRLDTQHDTDKQDMNALFFLACVSLRRLLNRAHHLLYAQGLNTNMSGHSRYNRFPFSIIQELELQLDAWRASLPPSLAFADDPDAFGSQEDPFRWYLKQKYLSCRALILRPYVQYWLSTAERDLDEDSTQRMTAGFVACIGASTEHLTGLRGFSYTVMANAWIASLSCVTNSKSNAVARVPLEADVKLG